MKVLFVKEYTAKTSKGDIRTVAAGAVLNLSPDKAGRLITAEVAVGLDTIIAAWREFTLSADKLYRTTSKSSDAWNQHLKHVHAAEALFISGNIAEARIRLKNALVALSGVQLVQTGLDV